MIQKVKEYAVIVAGTAVVAAAVYFFMLPSHLAVGSASALAMIIGNFIPLPVSVIVFILNAVLLVVGFLLIGPEFGGKTVFTSLLMPVFMWVFEVLFPNMVSLTQDPVVDLVCYILVVSVGLSLLFSCNASSGGMDIVAKLMSKYLHMDLGKAVSVSGIAVSLSSVFFYDKYTVVLGVIGTYFCGMMVDHFIFGLNIKRRVCILSPKVDQIAHYILHELHSGASLYDVTGAYEGTVRKEIVTIVDKQEYRKLMDYVRQTDATAFVTVYSVNEIIYQPKK